MSQTDWKIWSSEIFLCLSNDTNILNFDHVKSIVIDGSLVVGSLRSTHLIICCHLVKSEFFPSKLVCHEEIELQVTRAVSAGRPQRTQRMHTAAFETSLSSPRCLTVAPQSPRKHPPRYNIQLTKLPHTSDSASGYTIVFSTTDNNKNNQCHNVVIELMNKLNVLFKHLPWKDLSLN